MERYCSAGQSPQRAVAPTEERKERKKERKKEFVLIMSKSGMTNWQHMQHLKRDESVAMWRKKETDLCITRRNI